MKKAEWSGSLCKLSSRKSWDWRGIFMTCLLGEKKETGCWLFSWIYCLPSQSGWKQSFPLHLPPTPLTWSSHVLWRGNCFDSKQDQLYLQQGEIYWKTVRAPKITRKWGMEGGRVGKTQGQVRKWGAVGGAIMSGGNSAPRRCQSWLVLV